MDMDVSQDLEDTAERNRHVQDMSGTFPTKLTVIKNKISQKISTPLLCMNVVHMHIAIDDMSALLLLNSERTYGEDALTPDKLKEIFDQDPTQLLQDASPHLHELSVFVLKYGRCAANRDQLLMTVMKDQKDAFCKDPEAEKKNEFRCVADYLTKTIWGGRHGSL
jgi:hypothetical protein